MKIEIKGINKSFDSVHILKGINIEIYDREVHALMGENGAGKSTLIKVITGVYSKDSGDIFIDGEKVTINTISDSEKYHIAYVHQELNIVREMTVCENLFLGKEIVKNRILDNSTMEKICLEKLSLLGIDNIKPNEQMKNLSVGYQQMVEIAKALLINAKLIILDEPTAALTNKEIENLFIIINKLKQQGVSFLYVSHRMEEIFRICDRISILRDGYFIGTECIKDISQHKLVEMMTGKDINDLYRKDRVQLKNVAIEVRNLCKKGVFNNINFAVREGEVLGFAGLMGAGRSEIMHAIFGSDPNYSGQIYIDGKLVKIKNPIDGKKHGIGFVTEDRKEEGLILDFNVEDNTVVPSLPSFTKKCIVNDKKINDVVNEYINNLKIKAFSSKQIVKSLSGGNQQKIVFAKWLETKPKILILDEPTRGVDVGAKKEIYEVINNLKKQGVAIILVSSELPEVVGISDRVAVIHNKTIAKIFDDEKINHEDVLKVAFLGAD